MRSRPAFVKWLVILGVLHAIIVCAGFFAPYDPLEQDRKKPYLPPMPVHLMDAQGRFHLRPFAYALKLQEGTFDQYEQDFSHPVPIRVFTSGAGYRLFGFLPLRIHLFGSEGTRICLLGSDGYGRDQFSGSVRRPNFTACRHPQRGVYAIISVCVGGAAGTSGVGGMMP
jgi:peptide/nickel transport system permease protein